MYQSFRSRHKEDQVRRCKMVVLYPMCSLWRKLACSGALAESNRLTILNSPPSFTHAILYCGLAIIGFLAPNTYVINVICS